MSGRDAIARLQARAQALRAEQAQLRAGYIAAVRDGRPTSAEQRSEMQRHAAAARIARRGAERNAAICRAERESAQVVIDAATETVTEEERRWLAE